MKRLKIILQSNKLYISLFILISLYIFIFTYLIKYNSAFTGSEKEISGKIVSYKIDGDKFTALVKSKEKIIVYYYFKNETEKNWFINNMKINNSVSIKGELLRPQKNTIPNLFNYQKYLYNQKIFYLCSANNIRITKKGFSIKNNIIKRLNNFKRKDYMYSFVLGDKSYLDDTKIKENGISHLLAISGMHVSFLVALLKNKLKIKNDFIINIILLFYSYLVAFQVGVVRVLLFRIIKILFKNVISDIKILFLCAFLLLIINPFYLYNAGFLYSFLISATLLLVPIKGNYFLSIIKISAISLIVTLPITIFLNFEINVFSIINNIIFVPFVTFILFPLSLITVLIPKIEFIFSFFCAVFDKLNLFVPQINVVFPKPNFILIFVYYLLLFLCFRYKKKSLMVTIGIGLLSMKYNCYLNNVFQVTYLDVSQGDSELVLFPNYKKSVLIDSGGKVKNLKENWKTKTNEYLLADSIILYLKSLGISKLNYFVVTHGDYDHMGEAINLVENFKVENVIFNCGPYNDLEKELIKVLENKNIKYHSCIKELNIDKYKLQFLNTKEYDNENDNSSVIYFNYNNYKFLFMGDAGIEKEKDILEKYNLKDIDFLKVGHHGSNTSSSELFINSISPKYSFISVGKNNRYGHPKESVLNTLKNSTVYRTDLDGSIEIKLNMNGCIYGNAKKGV